MTDLFGHTDRYYKQERINRVQLVPDREFYRDLLRVTYDAGPRGVPMRQLMNIGITRRWWQDTCAKHFGEKMRAAWSFGLIVVNEKPGTKGGTAMKRIVHPAYFRIEFDDSRVQRNWDQLIATLPLIHTGEIE